ncbi:MAG: glycerol-3-phosphate 1-O-acyltransferase PlsY [Phycisphaerae bacterium]
MTDNPIILLVVLPLAAYVLGSTPFGVLLAKAHGMDLRKVGSGNVGATNVARALGRKWGYICFLLDTGKGLTAVLVAGLLLRRLESFPTLLHQASWLGVGCGVILGHVFSFYLRFRGGKGVATALGVVVGIYPYFTFAGLAALGVWIVVVLLTKYVSLASLAAAGAFLPLFAAFNWPVAHVWPLVAFAAVMVALIVLRHRDNIRRLIAGTENRIGARHSDE